MNGKFLLFFSSALAAVTLCLQQAFSFENDSAVYCSEKSEIDDLRMRICALEQCQPTCCFSEGIGCGFFITAEFIYWKASESGLNYVIEGEHATSIGNISQLIMKNGKARRPDFEYHPGFRVGAGWVMNQDCWDIYSNYTRYHLKERDSADIGAQQPDIAFIPGFTTPPPAGNYLYPFWIGKLFINSLPSPINSAKAVWKLDLDLIDVELGKKFFVSNCFSLRPSIGMRMGWIDQKYVIDYTRLQTPFGPTNFVNQWQLDMKNDFWGIGIKTSLEANWHMGCGFSIFGKADFSLLSGCFDTNFQQAAQSYDEFGMMASDDFFENKSKFHANVAAGDLGIGLEWNKSFCCNCFLVAIWLEYEQHIFFQQNQFMNFQYDFTLVELLEELFVNEGPNYYTDNGNLTLDGLTVGIKIGF